MGILPIIILKFNRSNKVMVNCFQYCDIQKTAYWKYTENGILNMPPSV
jgi:hypothetical protein